MVLRSKFTLGRNSSFRLNVWAFEKVKDCSLRLLFLLLYYCFTLFLSLHKRLDSFSYFYTQKKIDQRNQVYILLCMKIDVRSKGYLFVSFIILLRLYLGNESTNKMRFIVGPRTRFFLFAVFKGKLKQEDIFFHQIKMLSSLSKL